MSRKGETRVGAFYVLGSLPAWVMLALGTLVATRNAYLLFALAGLPLGVAFLWFGRKRPANARSWAAVRVGSIGLFFLATAMMSRYLVWRGVEAFETSVQFCAMAGTFTSLVAAGILVAAFAGGGPVPGREPRTG